MNEEEKKEFYIAMCSCWLIASVLKSCPLREFKEHRARGAEQAGGYCALADFCTDRNI